MLRKSTRRASLIRRLMLSRDSSVSPRHPWPVKVVLLFFMSAALLANAPPSSGLEGLGHRVSDEQLSDMRGKFVTPNNISYFGVSMMTSWENAEGVITSAVMVFSVDFMNGAGNPDGASPEVAVAWNRDCAGCADPSMDVVGFGPDAQNGYVAITPSFDVVPVGGLNSVSGAVQSQQIAGSDNSVLNSMQIAVVPASVAKTLGPAGLEMLSHSSGQQFADGSTLNFQIGSNMLGISMSNAAGTGIVQQAINGNMNQAIQHVLLGDNFNGVSNSMVITLGVDSLAQQQQLHADNAIAAIKTTF